MEKLVTVILPMPKDTHIQIRVNDEVKKAIAAAAERDGRSISNWLIWLAANADPDVATALKK
jgi:uncharacterized protein (DUF1778 family)